MHGAGDHDDTWLVRTNWLWLIVTGLSAGVWHLVGWMSRKCPRRVTPAGLGAIMLMAAVAVAAVGLRESPEGMAADLTSQAAGALFAAALVALVVATFARAARRRRQQRKLARIRVLPRPREVEGRHRMILVNDGHGPMIDARMSVHIRRRKVSYLVCERPRIGEVSSVEFDVINKDVATHLPFAPDDALVAEWVDRRGDLHREEWRLGDHMFWGYPVAFDAGSNGDGESAVGAVRSR